MLAGVEVSVMLDDIATLTADSGHPFLSLVPGTSIAVFAYGFHC